MSHDIADGRLPSIALDPAVTGFVVPVIVDLKQATDTAIEPAFKFDIKIPRRPKKENLVREIIEVGRVVAHPGSMTVIDAMKFDLIEQAYNASLCIFGVGYLRQHVKNQRHTGRDISMFLERHFDPVADVECLAFLAALAKDEGVDCWKKLRARMLAKYPEGDLQIFSPDGVCIDPGMAYRKKELESKKIRPHNGSKTVLFKHKSSGKGKLLSHAHLKLQLQIEERAGVLSMEQIDPIAHLDYVADSTLILARIRQ